MNSGSCSQKESPPRVGNAAGRNIAGFGCGGAGAAGRGQRSDSTRLLESERAQGFTGRNDTFLLTYLYCLNGSVEKAETLAAAAAGSTS